MCPSAQTNATKSRPFVWRLHAMHIRLSERRRKTFHDQIILFFRGSPHISRRTFKMTRSRCCDMFGLSKKTISSLLRKHRRVKHVSGANAESFQSVTPWTGNASTSVASQVSSSRAVGCVSGTTDGEAPRKSARGRAAKDSEDPRRSALGRAAMDPGVPRRSARVRAATDFGVPRRNCPKPYANSKLPRTRII